MYWFWVDRLDVATSDAHPLHLHLTHAESGGEWTVLLLRTDDGMHLQVGARVGSRPGGERWAAPPGWERWAQRPTRRPSQLTRQRPRAHLLPLLLLRLQPASLRPVVHALGPQVDDFILLELRAEQCSTQQLAASIRLIRK